MEKSLAQYINELRENIGLSTQGLSKKAAIPLDILEDIQNGKDLFLPSTLRQKLARALKVNPSEIKEYERIMLDKYDSIDESYIQTVKKAILEGDVENLKCPLCSSKMVTRIVKLSDMYDNEVLCPKARCSKCTFQIK